MENFLLNSGFNNEKDLIFIKEMYKTFLKLYSWRIDGDYEKIVISKENLEEAIEKAEMFINDLKKIQLRINL